MDHNKLLVVVISIGETSSGYGFSFRDSPLNVKFIQWAGHRNTRVHLKVPSSILLDSNKNFKAFGFEAEDEYLSLLEEGRETEVYFFQHFLLHSNRYHGTDSDFMVKAFNRKTEVSVDTLIQFGVSHFKDHFFKTVMNKSPTKSMEADFFWILTYPDDLSTAYYDMALAACKKADINPLNLIIVEESTAIVAFCEQFESDCFILDCSITQLCQKITDSFRVMTCVHEMSPIADEFWKMINEYCEPPLSEQFEYMELYDFYSIFEGFLQSCQYTDSMKRVQFSLPFSFMSSLKERVKSNAPFKTQGPRLILDVGVLLQLFEKATERLQQHFRNGIRLQNYTDKKRVILVGDFSIYPLLKTVLQNKFPQFTFSVPNDSSSSVLIGAVILAHQSNKSCTFIPKHPTEDKAFIALEERVKSAQISSGHGTKREETEDFHEHLSDETTVTGDNSTTAVSLPDPLRPGRISSMFQDLYEVEHADGIKALCKRGVNKDEAMQLMVDILRNSYGACRYQALSQIDHISSTLLPRTDEKEFAATLPPEILQSIMSYRKKNALKYLPEITKTFINELPGKLDISDDLISSCGTFIEKSLECCWLMCVTDPPLFLQFDWNRPLTIDPNLWITEGSSGYYAKTVIWPILYLRENGPVMNKGVALAE